MVNVLPEPFIGDPESAKVVLLNLNPGYDSTVAGDHRRPEIKDAIFRNRAMNIRIVRSMRLMPPSKERAWPTIGAGTRKDFNTRSV